MTPEERFTKMENLLQAMMEHQAKQQEQIDKHSEQIQKHAELIEKHTEQIQKHSEQIEKQNAGIRDLIVVSRTVLDSVQELRDAQVATNGKLNILIDTVDRIVRQRESREQG
jgi:septal ring factor EnvC (AmiA/AmiB activator)